MNTYTFNNFAFVVCFFVAENCSAYDFIFCLELPSIWPADQITVWCCSIVQITIVNKHTLILCGKTCCCLFSFYFVCLYAQKFDLLLNFSFFDSFVRLQFCWIVNKYDLTRWRRNNRINNHTSRTIMQRFNDIRVSVVNTFENK